MDSSPRPASPTSPVVPTPTGQPVSPAESSLRIQPDILQRLDWLRVFGRPAPVELELGSGDGSFLLAYAAAHPERNFLGVERLLGRLRKLDRKGRRAGLLNLRGLRLEAGYVLEWMIPDHSLEALHVYFPDPWPKRRHWKRRLINPAFTQQAARVLAPGGVVYLRTDETTYFAQMQEVFSAHPGFAPVVEPPDLLACRTDFEVDFNAQGIPTCHAAWRLGAV
jgi:tRNA (guanine-N7-)-methyltransferase